MSRPSAPTTSREFARALDVACRLSMQWGWNACNQGVALIDAENAFIDMLRKADPLSGEWGKPHNRFGEGF